MQNTQFDFSKETEQQFYGKQIKLLADLSEELLLKLTAIYPFPEGIERNIVNFKREFIKKIPKTDLHVHGEAGSFMDVELARKLAKRNNVRFPEELVDEKNAWKYRGKENFFQFIKDFLVISSLICTPEDVEDVAYAFYRDCYNQNVIFSLLGISWVQCKERMTFVEFNQAYNRALVRGMQDFGDVTILRLRYYLERHDGKESVGQIVEKVLNTPNPFVTTIGLAGGEENYPLSDFEEYYKEIQEHRNNPQNPWYFLTAHMEKHSDHETILKAVVLLDWIAHGRRAADDPITLETLKSMGITFESCPLSDKDGYPEEIPTLDKHQQCKKLIENGMASLNSDDPAFFGNINEVYRQAFEELSLSFSQLLQCTGIGLNPASPTALKEMENVNKQEYAKYNTIVKAGKLKIEFFQGYWELLPLLVNVEENLAKKLIVIDLKTTRKEFNVLQNEIPTQNEELIRKFNTLIQLKFTIDNVTKIISESTLTMEKDFNVKFGKSILDLIN